MSEQWALLASEMFASSIFVVVLHCHYQPTKLMKIILMASRSIFLWSLVCLCDNSNSFCSTIINVDKWVWEYSNGVRVFVCVSFKMTSTFLLKIAWNGIFFLFLRAGLLLQFSYLLLAIRVARKSSYLFSAFWFLIFNSCHVDLFMP